MSARRSVLRSRPENVAPFPGAKTGPRAQKVASMGQDLQGLHGRLSSALDGHPGHAHSGAGASCLKQNTNFIDCPVL